MIGIRSAKDAVFGVSVEMAEGALWDTSGHGSTGTPLDGKVLFAKVPGILQVSLREGTQLRRVVAYRNSKGLEGEADEVFYASDPKAKEEPWRQRPTKRVGKALTGREYRTHLWRHLTLGVLFPVPCWFSGQYPFLNVSGCSLRYPCRIHRIRDAGQFSQAQQQSKGTTQGFPSPDHDSGVRT